MARKKHYGKQRWPATVDRVDGMITWRLKGWDGYGDDPGLSAFYEGNGDEFAFWIYETAPPGRFMAREEGWRLPISHQGSKADMLRFLAGEGASQIQYTFPSKSKWTQRAPSYDAAPIVDSYFQMSKTQLGSLADADAGARKELRRRGRASAGKKRR